jgi:hypothetical protein
MSKETPAHEAATTARAKRRSKVIRINFELNLAQTKDAREMNPADYGASSLNVLAKRLFLQQLNEESSTK